MPAYFWILKVGKRIADVRTLHGAQEIFSAQMQRLVGKLNLARTAVMGRVRRVALRTLYDFAMRGGGGEWALEPGRRRGVGFRFRCT